MAVKCIFPSCDRPKSSMDDLDLCPHHRKMFEKYAKVDKSPNILQEADCLVNGDRQQAYGHPLDDFLRTAKIWSAILGIAVTPEQVGLCMAGLKISRECNKHHRDNLVDGAGYLATVEKVIDEKRNRLSDGALDELDRMENRVETPIGDGMGGFNPALKANICVDGQKYWIICEECQRLQSSEKPWDTVPDCAFCKITRRRVGFPGLEKPRG